MKGRQLNLHKKCLQILHELDELSYEAESEFDVEDPNYWWNKLDIIMNKIDNFQQGEKLPLSVWVEMDLPSEDDEDNSDYEWFKLDLSHARRGVLKIQNWLSNYWEEPKQEEPKQEEPKQEEPKQEEPNQ